MFNNTIMQLPDEVLSTLDFITVDASALVGFSISQVEPGIGTDGVSLLLGHYSDSEAQEYVFQIYLDDSIGIVYERAQIGGNSPV